MVWISPSYLIQVRQLSPINSTVLTVILQFSNASSLTRILFWGKDSLKSSNGVGFPSYVIYVRVYVSTFNPAILIKRLQ